MTRIHHQSKRTFFRLLAMMDIDLTIDHLSRELRRLEQEDDSQRTPRGLEVRLLQRRLANLRQVRKAQIQTRKEVLREYRDVLSNTFTESISPMITSKVSALLTKLRDCINFDEEVFYDSRSSVDDAAQNITPKNTTENLGVNQSSHDTSDDDYEMDITWKRIKNKPKEVHVTWKRIKSSVGEIVANTHGVKESRRHKNTYENPQSTPHKSIKLEALPTLDLQRTQFLSFNSATRRSLDGHRQSKTVRKSNPSPRNALDCAVMHCMVMSCVFAELRSRISYMKNVHAKIDAVIEELVKRLLVREVCQKMKARKEKKAKVHAMLSELTKKFLIQELQARCKAQDETRNNISKVLFEFTRRVVLQEICKNAKTRPAENYESLSHKLNEQHQVHARMQASRDEIFQEMLRRWVVTELKKVFRGRNKDIYRKQYYRVMQELAMVFIVRGMKQRLQAKQEAAEKSANFSKQLKERVVRDAARDMIAIEMARKEHYKELDTMLAELGHRFVVNEMKARCAIRERKISIVLRDLKEQVEWVDVADESEEIVDEWVKISDTNNEWTLLRD